MKIKFIYWFAYYNLDSPSVRYRGKYCLDLLKSKYGIQSFFIVPGYNPKRLFRFIIAYLSALIFRKKNSLIVVQRVHSNFIYSSLLKLLVSVRNKNTIYDLDDADYLEHPPETIYFFIKNCSAVSVGSLELCQNLSGLNKRIILNTSPTPDYKIIKKERNAIFTIGWIGDFSGGHKESMIESFFPALDDLHFKIKLILLGVKNKSIYAFNLEYFQAFKNITLEMPQDIDWKNERDIQKRISKFDIGIATLLDNELQRSKSAFKTKQYLNNGVPVLSSDIRENNLFVENGKNGFLCSNYLEFRKRIIEIHEMSDEDYYKLSSNARKSITMFNLAKYCEELIRNFKQEDIESIGKEDFLISQKI
jgi:glycosyltransferase involved in cell wall biosynthesis